jgi:hypothetical protein
LRYLLAKDARPHGNVTETDQMPAVAGCRNTPTDKADPPELQSHTRPPIIASGKWVGPAICILRGRTGFRHTESRKRETL